MVLRLDDRFLWDFWFAPRQEPEDPFHVFFLQAPRDFQDPERRHNLATVGHALSDDLVTWEYLGTALEPGPPGAWDDFTIWTGCVIRNSDGWRMFYTGRNRAENGLVQRIGCAVSHDLLTWTRHDANPVLEADAAWYQQRVDELGFASDCRDPWVIRHNDRWLLFFTASDRNEPRHRRGVVGLATSDDLRTWRHHGSVTAGRDFCEIEVPQVFQAGDRWGMLFCTGQHSQKRVEDGMAWFGTHGFFSDSPFGPFTVCSEPPLLADELGTLYGARLLDDPWLPPTLMAWRRLHSDGHFAGELTDPMRVEMRDGCLRLQQE